MAKNNSSMAPGQAIMAVPTQELSCTLHIGDNYRILREVILPGTIKFVYLDPPYNSKANYNQLIPGCSSQQKAYQDTWYETRESLDAWTEEKSDLVGRYDRVIRFIEETQDTSCRAYLMKMAPRMLAVWVCLASDGVMAIQCDDAACHYLKILGDMLFGPSAFVQQLYVERSTGKVPKRLFPRNHEVILIFARSRDYTFNPQFVDFTPEFIIKTFNKNDHDGRGPYTTDSLTGDGFSSNDCDSVQTWDGYDPKTTGKGRHWAIPSWTRDLYTTLAGPDEDGNPRLLGNTITERLDRLQSINMIFKATDGSPPRIKRYLELNPGGTRQSDLLDGRLSSNSKERVGYDTQKPLSLMQLLVRTYTNEGDSVLEAYCGSGSCMFAALAEKRRAIGIEIAPEAAAVAKQRITKAFGDAIFESVASMPTTLDDFQALALQGLEGRKLVEKYACEMLGGQHSGQAGTDNARDGFFAFNGMPDGKQHTGVIQVKTGEVITPVKDLARFGEMFREGGYTAGAVVLYKRTQRLDQWAAGFGTYEDEHGQRFPVMQLITVGSLYNPDMKYGGLQVPHHVRLAPTLSVRVERMRDVQAKQEIDSWDEGEELPALD